MNRIPSRIAAIDYCTDLRANDDATDKACDVPSVIEPPMVRTLKVESHAVKGIHNSKLSSQAKAESELCFEVHVARRKRILHRMKLAVLLELISIVVTPRTENGITEAKPPTGHRLQGGGKGWSIRNRWLVDSCQICAELREFGMPNRADKCLEFSVNFKRPGILHDRSDFDDLHFSPRHGTVV